MNRKCSFEVVVVVAIVIAMMLTMGSTGIIDKSMAKKYSKNQATTQASHCGNGEISDGSNMPDRRIVLGSTSCQNINSQIQGDDNSVALAGVHDGVS